MAETFLHVARGNRYATYMKLVMDDGHVFKYLPDYTGLELGLRDVIHDEKKIDKATRGQSILLESTGIVKPISQYKVLVSVNRELLQYANAPAMFIIDPSDTPERVSIIAHFRKDMDLDKLTWLFRLYLLS